MITDLQPVAPDAEDHRVGLAQETAAHLLGRVRAMERARHFDLHERSRAACELQRLALAAGEETTAARAALLDVEAACARGDLEGVDVVMEGAAALALARGDLELLARSHFTRSVLHRQLGEEAVAVWHAVRAVEAVPDSAPPLLRGLHLVNLTVLLVDSSDAFEGIVAEVLQIAEEEGAPDLELTILNNAAWNRNALGRRAEALAMVERMRETSALTGIPLRVADLDTVARVELDAGLPEAAHRTIGEALAPGTPDNAILHRVQALLTSSAVLTALGRPAEAALQLELARHEAQVRQLPAMLAEVEEATAAASAAAGDWEAAYRAHVRFYSAQVQLRQRQDAARAAVALARFDADRSRRERDRLRDLAYTDALTGLPNRRAVEEHAHAVLPSASTTAVALLDLDRFKQVNDGHSHEVGDEVLRQVGALLAAHASAAPGTFAARLGGEEFVVLWSGRPVAAVMAAAEALRAAVAAHDWAAVSDGLAVTVSIGVSASTGGPATWSDLAARADVRLYEAKHAGRDRVVGPPLTAPVLPVPVGTGS